MPINSLTTCSSSGEGYCFSWQDKFVFLPNATNAKITVCAQMFTMPNIENRLKASSVRKQPLVPTTRKQLGLLKINSLSPHLISGRILEKYLRWWCEKHIHLKKASEILILDNIFYRHLPIGSVSSYFGQSNAIAGNVLFQISWFIYIYFCFVDVSVTLTFLYWWRRMLVLSSQKGDEFLKWIFFIFNQVSAS